MNLQPYLFFNGDCEAALIFYAQALKGDIEAKMRYGECPEPVPQEHLPAGGVQSILHASLRVGEQRLLMSDGVPTDGGGHRGFSLTLQYATEAEARAVFDALSKDGEVQMPLGATFFSPCYGMLKDRFGVQWMVIVFDPQAQ